MRRFSRIGVLAAALVFVWPVFAFAQVRVESDKVKFMKAAIESIKAGEGLVAKPQQHKPAPQSESNTASKPSDFLGLVPMYISRVEPFGDWDFYYTTAPLIWKPNPGDAFTEVVVPAGFVSDLASVPQILWAKYPPTGRYAYAAVVHDYLYWMQERRKEEADRIFAIALKDSGVDKDTVADFNLGLTLGGTRAWNENTKLRNAGEKRLLKTFPDDPLISWKEYRKKPGIFAD